MDNYIKYVKIRKNAGGRWKNCPEDFVFETDMYFLHRRTGLPIEDYKACCATHFEMNSGLFRIATPSGGLILERKENIIEATEKEYVLSKLKYGSWR